MSDFEIEAMGESGGHCDCCGRDSHSVWGMVHRGPATVAAYWMQWTEGHLSDLGANLDLVIGSWGDGTSADDRTSVSLWHKEMPVGSSSMMVVDAVPKPTLAANGLLRSEVIGTPMADHVFALVDAIYDQDNRFF